MQHLIARFGRYETPEAIQRFANIPKADGEGRGFDMSIRVEKD
jgi:hypothetical protein